MKKINAALVSVFYKDGLEPIVKKLDELGVQIISTGGTEKFIKKLGIDVTRVEDLTSYPSILGGRVKTLHPKVFGGILARRDHEGDIAQLEEFDIPEIDLTIVDLYPFEETVAGGGETQDIIEKIDIGGISLIRAAAKNYKEGVIVASRDQYTDLLDTLNDKQGFTDMEDRKAFAAHAFKISSHYDSAIFNWFNGDGNIDAFKASVNNGKTLRYGENPHQSAKFYGDLDAMFDQLHGKELSYNNLVDVDGAVNLIAEFKEDPTFCVIKHTNACGLASRPTIVEAWEAALAGDPVSAFGGILAANRNIDKATAEKVNNIFFEIIIAPSYDEDALEILKTKKNRIILIQKEIELPKRQFKTLLNGVIEQDIDFKSETSSDFETVTKLAPTDAEVKDLVFASKLAKHTKSNTIVLAKNQQLIGSGMGQTSRVDALKQAIVKAKAFNFETAGAVIASDAFFPFADCVEIAYNEGVNAVVQPGGSIRDKDSVEYCDNNDMAMVLTGTRHFKH